MADARGVAASCRDQTGHVAQRRSGRAWGTSLTTKMPLLHAAMRRLADDLRRVRTLVVDDDESGERNYWPERCREVDYGLACSLLDRI